jgi:hypothetical protein
MHNNSEIGRNGVAEPPPPPPLLEALATRTRHHVIAGLFAASGSFECPDCDGELECSTCGEPSRQRVGAALRRAA